MDASLCVTKREIRAVWPSHRSRRKLWMQHWLCPMRRVFGSAKHTYANQQTRRSGERLTKSCIVPLTLYLKNSKQKIKSLNVYFNMCVDAIREIRYFTLFILAFTNVKEPIKWIGLWFHNGDGPFSCGSRSITHWAAPSPQPFICRHSRSLCYLSYTVYSVAHVPVIT